jgi:hypothetical protein
MENASTFDSPLSPDSERIVRVGGAGVKEAIANPVHFSWRSSVFETRQCPWYFLAIE